MTQYCENSDMTYGAIKTWVQILTCELSVMGFWTSCKLLEPDFLLLITLVSEYYYFLHVLDEDSKTGKTLCLSQSQWSELIVMMVRITAEEL